jgi:hypothetical protein
MAIVNIPKKVCPHCGGTKWQTKKFTNPDKYKCAKREIELVQEWREKNNDKYKKHGRKYYQENRERYAVYGAKYRKENRGHYRAYHKRLNASPEGKAYRKKLNDKYNKELTDSYVRCVIRNTFDLDFQPTEEQINNFRIYLKTKREYEKQKNRSTKKAKVNRNRCV